MPYYINPVCTSDNGVDQYGLGQLGAEDSSQRRQSSRARRPSTGVELSRVEFSSVVEVTHQICAEKGSAAASLNTPHHVLPLPLFTFLSCRPPSASSVPSCCRCAARARLVGSGRRGHPVTHINLQTNLRSTSPGAASYYVTTHPDLLGISQAQTSRSFLKLSELSFAEPCNTVLRI